MEWSLKEILASTEDPYLVRWSLKDNIRYLDGIHVCEHEIDSGRMGSQARYRRES
jgi:hypothetical protein